MGHDHSKPETKLKLIDREVNSISSGMRGPRRTVTKDNREKILGNLIQRSTEVNELKGKVKKTELQHTQRNISQTIEDILNQVPRESQLDSGAVETNSIVNVPVNKGSSLVRSTPDLIIKRQKVNQGSQLKQSMPTLKEIDDKLKHLKTHIQVAIENGELTQLRVHQQTLKILAADLEMIEVPEDTPLGDKKKKLDNSVMSQYQKIGKVMKEIRRSKDISYLAKQNQKEQIIKQLNEIKKELDESEQIMKIAIKNGDLDGLNTVQQNLVAINQKLTSVEIVDENTRNIKLDTIDKLTWLTKYITEASKKESQSDLTKAENNYEDLIKTIASGKNKDQDDVKTKLESLQSFIGTIESEDDDSMKRKKKLLSNINVSLTSINETELRRAQASNTIDNAVLERKVSFDIKVLVENFFSDWRVLQDTIKTTKLTREEYRLLDRLLGDIQNSIAKTRKMITNVYDAQNNLKSKLNKSAPNLSSSPQIHKKFASSISVDQPSSVIKTKAKMYDLHPPLVENVSEQTIHLRSVSPRQENRFSEIDEIRAQISYIKEKFENSNQKDYFKSKLETYAKVLYEYLKSDNKSTVNKATILLHDVQEMLKNIQNQGLPIDKRTSIERTFQNIVKIQESIDHIERIIHEFHGNKNDEQYLNIRQMLIDSRTCLIALRVSPQYNMIYSQKQDVLNRIDNLLESLERKVTNTFYEEAYVVNAKKSLNSLKEKVNRFSGAYKGVLYNKIEKDLNKLLIDSENIEDKETADLILKDAEKYLQILEHRATKDQSFRQVIKFPKSEEEEKMTNLKLDLQHIKKDIDTTPMSAVKLFIALNSRLDLVKIGLDQLKHMNENNENQKQILYNEVETLKNVVEAKIALSQQGVRQWTVEEKKQMDEKNKKAVADMNKIEESLQDLKKEISEFVGTKSDKRYFDLDERSIRLTLKMDDLDLPQGNDQLYNRRSNLLKEIHQYEEILEDRAKETENLIQFERDITDIENNFERYTGSVKELENLADRVKVLQLNLESSSVNVELKERKQTCVSKMRAMIKKIKFTIEETNFNEEKLSKLTLDLEAIRRTLGRSNYEADGLELLKKDLKSINGSLEDIKNLNAINSQHRDTLFDEVETLNNMVDDKIVEAQKNFKEKAKKEASNKRLKSDLDKIEETMKTLRGDIETYVGTSVDSKYCDLHEVTNRLINKLDVMKMEKDSTFNEKKIKLSKELYHCSQTLEKRAKDTETLLEFEQELKVLESNFEKYGSKTVKEKMDTIQNNLTQADLNVQLIERKKKSLNKIRDLSRRLEDKKVKETEEQIKELKGHIDSFKGTKKDKEYSDLVTNITVLTLELDDIKVLSGSSIQEKQQNLRKDLDNYLKLLDSKSKENESLGSIIDKINKISNQIEKSTNNDHLSTLQKDIAAIQADIEKSTIPGKLKNDVHKKCIILLQKFSQKKNDLSKLAKYESPVVSNKDQIKPISNTIDQEFTEMEKMINELKNEVNSFEGNDQTETYKKLEEQLLKLNLRVKKIKVPSDGSENRRKLKLKEKIVDCLTSLDDRIQEYESLGEIEKETDKLDGLLTDKLNESDKNVMDEKLIALQVKLGKLQTGNILSSRKNTVMQKILNSMKKLKENNKPQQQHVESSEDEDCGTSV